MPFAIPKLFQGREIQIAEKKRRLAREQFSQSYLVSAIFFHIQYQQEMFYRYLSSRQTAAMNNCAEDEESEPSARSFFLLRLT